MKEPRLGDSVSVMLDGVVVGVAYDYKDIPTYQVRALDGSNAIVHIHHIICVRQKEVKNAGSGFSDAQT